MISNKMFQPDVFQGIYGVHREYEGFQVEFYRVINIDDAQLLTPRIDFKLLTAYRKPVTMRWR